MTERTGGRPIGECTAEELDTRASRVPSIEPDLVPARVRRRRERLRELRLALEAETAD